MLVTAVAAALINGMEECRGSNHRPPSFEVAHRADICEAGDNADGVLPHLALEAELESASKAKNPSPKFSIAASKLKRDGCLAHKNRVAIFFPSQTCAYLAGLASDIGS